jgi:hypothetical protein
MEMQSLEIFFRRTVHSLSMAGHRPLCLLKLTLDMRVPTPVTYTFYVTRVTSGESFRLHCRLLC